MAMFGWCLDNHHGLCLGQIPDYTCACDCHKPEPQEDTK